MGYDTRERGWGRSGCFLRAATPHLREASYFCCRLRRLQDAAALDPVQRLRAAVGRISRAGLADSRARLRRVARRSGRRRRHGGRASGFRRYVDSVADAGADGAACSGRDEKLAVCAREASRRLTRASPNSTRAASARTGARARPWSATARLRPRPKATTGTRPARSWPRATARPRRPQRQPWA